MQPTLILGFNTIVLAGAVWASWVPAALHFAKNEPGLLSQLRRGVLLLALCWVMLLLVHFRARKDKTSEGVMPLVLAADTVFLIFGSTLYGLCLA